MLLRRYAVFGLLDASTARVVRPLQQRLAALTGNDLALRFPVHVTLRGRFWAEPESVVRVVKELDLGGEPGGELFICSPVFREPDLLWLSVEPDGPAPAKLLRLHGLLMNALGSVVIRDETSAAHAGSCYRPHVTLAWGATEETLEGLEPDERGIAVTATLEKVVLAEYPDTWPTSGSVAAVAELGHRRVTVAESVGASHQLGDGEAG